MNYVYVLMSESDKQFYTGATTNLKDRLEKHQKGRVPSTRNRQPLRLIHYEACVSKDDAFRREKYLKTGMGKRYLRKRLEGFLGEL